MKRLQAGLSITIFSLTALLGVGAFLYPFWLPAVVQNADAGGGMAHSGDSPLMLTAIVGICFAVLLVEVQAQAISAKVIALMGVLVAMNSVLRFAEVAVPMPGGFSPIFPLIILGGYVFGARIGFLLGSLTILASAFITGGVGPWMPYQMLAAGWVGMTAPLVRIPVAALRRIGFVRAWAEVALLALFGAFWGIAYGMIMNIWFWPFAMGSATMYWQPGISTMETLQRYAVFYVVTSAAWDAVAAVGNALLIVLLGSAVLRILRRFHQRFDFAYVPLPFDETQPEKLPLAPAPFAPAAYTHGSARSRAVKRTLHTGAWLIWLLATGIMLTVTRNPIYIGLVLLWVVIVLGALGAPEEGAARPLTSPLRFALIAVPIAALFNALFVHAGATVLFTLPLWLPVVGGHITLEALVYGALNGLVLTGLFAAFAVFNRVTPVRSLIQLAPRAYYPVAVTVAIALTYVPVTLRQAAQIREAQAVRGHRLKGLRGWAPILLPLLSSGMERALQLAEAMVARGFAAGGAGDESGRWRIQAMLAGGTALFIAGLVVRLVGRQPLLWAALLATGAALLFGAIWWTGRAHPHTVYRPAPWRAVDWGVVTAAGGGALLFLLPIPGVDKSSLAWYPYPALTWPSFSVALVVATWGLLGPVVVGAKSAKA